MIDIAVTYPKERAYGRVFEFAQHLYLEKIALVTTREPDVLVFAEHRERILGCIGLYRGDRHPELLFELCDPPDVYERLAPGVCLNRSLCGELGTRATDVPDSIAASAFTVSTAITAATVLVAHASGIRYLGGITNPLVRSMTRKLGLDMVRLGTPDFSSKDGAFQKNMSTFLSGRPICAGLRLHAVSGCATFLEECLRDGIVARLEHATEQRSSVA